MQTHFGLDFDEEHNAYIIPWRTHWPLPLTLSMSQQKKLNHIKRSAARASSSVRASKDMFRTFARLFVVQRDEGALYAFCAWFMSNVDALHTFLSGLFAIVRDEFKGEDVLWLAERVYHEDVLTQARQMICASHDLACA